MFAPDSGNAPTTVGEVPPDRVQMTLEDHLSAVLEALRVGIANGSLTNDDMMALRAFEEGKQAILQEALGQQQQGATPTVASLNGEERPYGSSPDDVPMPAQVGGY